MGIFTYELLGKSYYTKNKGFSQSIDMNDVRMGRVIKKEKKPRIFYVSEVLKTVNRKKAEYQ